MANLLINIRSSGTFFPQNYCFRNSINVVLICINYCNHRLYASILKCECDKLSFDPKRFRNKYFSDLNMTSGVLKAHLVWLSFF